ncbi:hypothetical protein B0T18DRAFT_393398 [Schizothecium vesticola]|uniref:Secreted protein n=1 Tax=Schizothecium vesticola TaxID=314040 RepID=A0AA40EJR4_9PEZI|nr:hypothetical protein B0T18DRAFT_393398 [Schizothecium vesticola]
MVLLRSGHLLCPSLTFLALFKPAELKPSRPAEAPLRAVFPAVCAPASRPAVQTRISWKRRFTYRNASLQFNDFVNGAQDEEAFPFLNSAGSSLSGSDGHPMTRQWK